MKCSYGFDPDLQNIDSYKEFKGEISLFVKIKLNSVFSVQNVCGVKLLSRLRLIFSHLNEHKVCHDFKDGTNSMCDCGSAIETLREKYPNTEFFLVHIFLYSDWIRRFTPLISVFSPNTGKYGPEKTPHTDTFHAVKKHYTFCHNASGIKQ